MELSKPPASEKPPIAAKPKLKNPPPRPPKPSTLVSGSKQPSPASSEKNDSIHEHGKESYLSQNGGHKASNSSAFKPKLKISSRALSAEALSLTESGPARSHKLPPPLPTAPPSVERRGNLSPSSSLSLPASFRRRSDLHTPLTLTTLIPFTSCSPTSPSSASQASPIRHVSPPRSLSKPKQYNPVSSPESDTSSENGRENNKNVQSPHITPENIAHTDAGITHLEIQTNTIISTTSLRKCSATPPQRPKSPPCKPVPSKEKPKNLSLKPSVPVIPLSRPIKNSQVQTKEKDNHITDIKSPGEKNQTTPPPLPKNPPRGGVPRKPRQSSFRSTSGNEGKVSLGKAEKIPHHDKDSNGIASADVVHLNDACESKILQDDCQNQQIHPTKDSKRLCDTSGEHVIADGAVQNIGETHIHTVDSNIKVSDVPSAKIPPKPLPRTRQSLLSPSDIGSINLMSAAEGKIESNISIPYSSLEVAIASAESKDDTEVEYAEVCRGNSEEHIDSVVDKCNTEIKGDLSQLSELLNIQDSHQNSEPTSAILQSTFCSRHSDNIMCQDIQDTVDVGIGSVTDFTAEVSSVLETKQSQYIDSSECVSYKDAVKAPNISNVSLILFQEEPEATFGMLKEIEELLKNKLGGIGLTLENSYAVSSSSNENTPVHRDGESEVNCENRAGSPTVNSSRPDSPVRPPRPKRQATITKHLGSLESLNSSSTECLANLGPTKVSDPSSGPNKKVIPPKPRRMFLPRVGRSNSDITGMKSIVDSNTSVSEEATQLAQEESKPFLPPRLESLRRNEPSSAYQSPPPLPPRNKPQCVSAKEIDGTDITTPIENSLNDLSFSNKSEPRMTDSVENLSSENISPTKKISKTGTLGRQRPARKAPPPPPGLLRSATFNSGDNKQPDNSQSEKVLEATQAPPPATVKRSNSALCRSYSTEMDDVYHEISDSVRTEEEAASQEKEESPPPALPPRCSQASLVNHQQEGSSVNLSESRVKNTVASNQSPGTAKQVDEIKSSNPKEQKMAKSALIQKVAQGLGLGKSSRKPKIPEIIHITGELNKVPAEESGNGEITTSASTVSGSKETDEESNDILQDTAETAAEPIPATEVSFSSDSSLNHLVSEVTEPSASIEQDRNCLSSESKDMEEIVSSGTDTEPEEDKEEIYAIRKAKKVFFIAKEIASSESTFVDVLKLLNLDFRIHISKSTEAVGHPVIPSETLNKILDYLPQLQNFNEDLLKDLNERIENWNTNPRLADIFVKKGPFLKLYSSYIRNFENATALLEDTTKKNLAFASALKEFEMSPRCAKLALKHYMLKPIQRIPQYKLLLQDYLKHLTEASLDYKDTVTALNIVSEVADHANDSMRHGDHVQRLLEIQRSLIGQFEVIQPGRVLVKKGELLKLSRKEMQPRMFFLFNDVLLYTTPATSGYRINNILPLTGMKINFPKLEDYKYEFNIISVQRSFTLSARTSEEKEQWVSALQTAIEENAKKHDTFQTVRQGPQTSLLDKDFILGHKAPLWVPDARVTMCMICLLEFTLTWRRHHCRSCGRVVCSHCSDNKAPLRYLKYEPARVCDKCFEKLRENLTNEYQIERKKRASLQQEEDSSTSVSEGAGDDTIEGGNEDDGSSNTVKHESGLSLNHLMSRFQKIRVSNREKRRPSNFRPSVLKEVHANDEGSDMSGYLRSYKSRKWKRLWFVVKGKVLYTYKASEDMAATESMPLLGYEVTRMNTWFEGAEPDLLFELTHQNNQPLAARKEGDIRVLPGTTQRLIFRTDSAAATTKWVTVLREASLTYQ